MSCSDDDDIDDDVVMDDVSAAKNAPERSGNAESNAVVIQDDDSTLSKENVSPQSSPMAIDDVDDADHVVNESRSSTDNRGGRDEGYIPSESAAIGMESEETPSFRITRVSRGRGGNSRSNQNSANGKSGAFSRKVVPGEHTLKRLMKEARYEADHDSYRGLVRYESPNSTAIPPSPWELSCSWYPIKPTVISDGGRGSDTQVQRVQDDNDDDERSVAEDMVHWACQNKCPTMIQWTERAIEQSRKKANGRKRKAANTTAEDGGPAFGQRPSEPKFRCACDYNPFCLSTLGGAMNEIILRDLRLSGGNSVSSNSVDNSENGGNRDDGEVVVVDDPIAKYRPKLRERLKGVRRSAWVEERRIRSYLKKTLQGLTSVMAMDDCIHSIREHHEKLCFENPVDEAEDPPLDQIKLSIPPGIENLGATCYLNTQLQCLAQNTVFLQGILSWEPPQNVEKRDRMTKILKQFQDLLASMVGGPDATTGTLEFSNALGLDHFEQQDPNEFSRLFFDKMHDSFQQGNKSDVDANRPDSKDGKYDLAQLLPHLFQGLRRYETTCLHCNTVSTRNEQFMDIVIPIAKAEEKKKAKGQQKLSDMFSTSCCDDVDVQFCLDQSIVDEKLEGDNKYLCDFCNEKQEATRRSCFQELPPVLNVQLSRYIFDMQTLSKKKVTEKVLLSQELIVDVKPEQNGAMESKRYILCAVMKHLGKSAYSGHYIAEAMDWVTGEWFEFNDDNVSLLKAGPSNSLRPDDDATREKESAGRPKKKLEGSQDAYNLYYVEESFLAQSALDFLRQRNPSSLPRALTDMAIKRKDAYADLVQFCLDESQIQHRLSLRRKLICEKVFPPQHKDVLQSTELEYIWIDGDFLRRFMSCDEPFEGELESNTFLTKYTTPGNFFCSHGNGMDPRVARRGKFLPVETFNSLKEIMEAEQRSCRSVSPANAIHGITFGNCSVCKTQYSIELHRKLSLVKKALELYEELDPKKDDPSALFKQESGGDEESKVFLVSRKFISAFRTLVVAFMKKANSVDANGIPDKSFVFDARATFESPAEGFDAMDASSLVDFGTGDEDEDNALDIRVNSNITCEHGNCKVNVTKRNIRYVSASLWEAIRAFFPAAIEHAVDSTSDEGNLKQIGCSQCESDDIITDTISAALSTLAKRCSQAPEERRLGCQAILELSPGAALRLVPMDDLSTLHKFSTAFKRPNTKTSVELYRKKISDIMLKRPESRFSFSPDEGNSSSSVTDFLWRCLNPLICKDHSQPIHMVLANDSHPSSGIKGLVDSVAVLDESEYKDFIVCLMAIGLLHKKLEKDDLSFDELDVEQLLKSSESLWERSNVSCCHPTATCADHSQMGDSSVVMSMNGPDMSVLFALKDGTCKDSKCMEKLKAWQAEWKKDVGSTAAKTSSQEPIMIDCDNEEPDSLLISIVEVKEETTDNELLQSLAQSAGTPLPEACDMPQVRRSGRRRKTRVPLGSIVSEETVRIDLGNNVASLRLLLMERSQEGSAYSLSHQLKLVIWPKTSSPEIPILVDVEEKPAPEGTPIATPKVIELPFAMNERSLMEICEEYLSSSCTMSDLENRVYIVRSECVDLSGLGIPEENLMDHLISLSSTSCPESKSSKGKRKKPEREKGFTGTFLTSTDATSAPLENGSPQKSAMKEDAQSSAPKQLSTPKRARFADEPQRPSEIKFAAAAAPQSNFHGDDARKPSEDAASPMQLSSTSTSSDSELSGSGLARLTNAAAITDSQPEEEPSQVDFELVWNIVSALVNSKKVSENNQALCMEAAEWVVRQNSKGKEWKTLVDPAFERFQSMTSNNH